MGNNPTKADRGTRGVSTDPHNAYRLRLGNDYLRMDCTGKATLVSEIAQPVPDQRYTFHLTHEKLAEDTVDGRFDVVKTLKLQATRCGVTYYLVAERSVRNPYPYRVSFRRASQDPGSGSTWILRPLSGGKFWFESDKYRGYCLTNEDGGASLQRLSKARRSKQITLYHVSGADRRVRSRQGSTASSVPSDSVASTSRPHSVASSTSTANPSSAAASRSVSVVSLAGSSRRASTASSSCSTSDSSSCCSVSR